MQVFETEASFAFRLPGKPDRKDNTIQYIKDRTEFFIIFHVEKRTNVN
jgi:hypothetical protein